MYLYIVLHIYSTSYSKMAARIGNDKWNASPSRNGTFLKQILASIPEFNDKMLTLKVNKKFQKPDKKRRKLSLGHTGFPSSNTLMNHFYFKKKETDIVEFQLGCVGKETPVRDVLISRLVKSSSSITGWEKIERIKQVFGRYIPINFSIQQHLLKLKEHLVDSWKKIYISFWIDGSNLAKLSTVLVKH